MTFDLRDPPIMLEVPVVTAPAGWSLAAAPGPASLDAVRQQAFAK
jgi:hypothetical protein